MDASRTSLRVMHEAFSRLHQHEHVRKVFAEYTAALKALEICSEQLWQLGERRFSAAIESRVMDLETQARRNLEAIEQRINANGASDAK